VAYNTTSCHVAQLRRPTSAQYQIVTPPTSARSSLFKAGLGAAVRDANYRRLTGDMIAGRILSLALRLKKTAA
jgi:hypothetical protein